MFHQITQGQGKARQRLLLDSGSQSTPPDAVHGHGENSSVAANWQTATWIASQSGHHHHTSHLLAEHQHQYMNNGFVSPSDAELALNTSGVCTHNVKSPYFFKNTRGSFSNKCAKFIKVCSSMYLSEMTKYIFLFCLSLHSNCT